MKTIKTSELHDSFDRYQRYQLSKPSDLDDNLDFQWWKEGVANLKEVIPIISAQYQVSPVSCIMAVRAQFPGGDVESIRRFCKWCADNNPP